MDFGDIKQKIEATEAVLARAPVADLIEQETPHGPLRVVITDRLRRKCKKGRVWKSTAMLTALKNAGYGYDAKAPRSRGGSDGIFLVDRTFKPPNAMMKKLFGQFLDKPDPLVSVLSDLLKTDPRDFIPVRLVSHHMRLLGVLSSAYNPSTLVLVDYDDDKH